MCKSAVQRQLCAPRRCLQRSQTARQGVCNCNPTSSRCALSEEDAEDKEDKEDEEDEENDEGEEGG